MMKNAIELQSVNLRFPKFALRDISLLLALSMIYGAFLYRFQNQRQ